MTGASFSFAYFVAASSPGDGAIAVSPATFFLLVFAGAIVFGLKLLLDLRRRIEALEARGAVRPPSTRNPVASLPATRDGDIPPAILAVIAAAVHVSLGDRHRIVAIEPASETRVWSLEGRRQIFHSHKVR